MLFNVCNGDLEKIDAIERLYSYEELIYWLGIHNWIEWKNSQKG
ncbi:hypothetical protein Cabys_3564 [Caldithrix abyssi DSM 13497]|uniref:Uncharacterized protein n=1 Tax=Caldithrix abyssi DSM 13497 TaxID=880073 RepID=A0A1J1C3Y0_CALAY|nr:hypothetical protein Cabys_250 [Caldithrix abyssi DSM 13497]APF20310.1 hypothetical protein Cabys_3564 [Caldithrix abyssi DSM 13497]